MIRLLLALMVVGGLLAAGAGAFVYSQMARISGPLQEDRIVYIAPGTGVNAMAAQLKAEGAIDAQWVFKVAARLHRANGTLKAGEYLVKDGMSVNDIIALLQSGKTHQRQITIPEGLMSVEIVALVKAAEGLEGDVTEIPREGSLLPETYVYSRGDSRQQLIARMQKSMEEALAALWNARAQDIAVNSPEEAVILASVVEKETGVASERPRVAGVFTNRLRINMPLQSDPTVIYALTQGQARLDRPLLRKDLTIDSPYNSYVKTGLPPTPIANPGKLSIAAVLNPERHDYFYFVADGTGGHAFGRSLDDHNRNVGKWRAIQKDNAQRQRPAESEAAPAPAAE